MNLDKIYNAHFHEICWCAKPEDFRIKYKQYEEMRRKFPRVKFHPGLPDNIKDLFEDDHKTSNKIVFMDGKISCFYLLTFFLLWTNFGTSS